ncbi:SpoIIE family protein phosphatase [Actinoplanes sp. NBC_00393]|uniref:PP2C family protein-serine/threonine phosphatase n=1 Tax=Actinoplanes sp. NBC_00393 TaxID=2975953 RepID=UPI002E1F90A9
MDAQQGYRQRLAELDAKIEQARPRPDMVCERAAGLLAGHIGCRIDEAHSHLRLLAAQQATPVSRVAADLIAALEPTRPTSSHRLREATDAALREAPPADRPPLTDPGTHGWTSAVQQVLDGVPGKHMLVVAVRDAAGDVVDYELAAVSPNVVDLSGRIGPHLIGRRISDIYPPVVGGPVWHAWADALADGRARTVGPFPYLHRDASHSSEHLLTVQVQPVGPGLLNSWIRQDEQTRLAERIAQTERLGNLGWGEWDLVTDATVWSEGLYRIYERDPADGPMPRAESEALGLPEDDPLRLEAAAAFGRGETVDVTTRVRVNEQIKYLRAVVDAIRDTEGRPVKIYGLVQDITAREASRRKLAEVERQLHQQQEVLAAEHRLAAQLQQIVLPIPQAPIDLPGLRAAVRYLPAEQASRVGGDWYHAAPAGDGGIILAVGDVAGHGVQAAATMAQLRHALATLAATTTSEPAVLLAYLNRIIYSSEPTGDTATAVVARYDPATHELTWAQAGHPAPLLARAGVTTELTRPHGPLLGAVPDPGYATATTALGEDDLLVLYTDGLVEHRSHSLAEGLVPVVAALNRATACPGEQSLPGMLADLHRANPDDDTCVLAARRLPAGGPS